MTKSTDEILASLLLPQGSDWRISLISTDEMEESIHVELEYVKPDVTVAGRHFPILDFCPARQWTTPMRTRQGRWQWSRRQRWRRCRCGHRHTWRHWRCRRGHGLHPGDGRCEPRELRGDARLDRPAVWLTLRLHREPARLLEGRAATVRAKYLTN